MAFGRRKRDHFEKIGGRLAHRDAVADHVRGKLALGDGDPVLDLDRVDVLVGADVERHREAVRAVVAALRAHVEHVLRAVDLLLDGSGYRLRDHVGIGAGEAGRHRDLRRNHLRVLGNRQVHGGQHADEDHHERDDGGEDRTLDEEVEHGYFFDVAGAGSAAALRATAAAATGFTGAPGRTLPRPSITIRSPACNPLSTTQSLPIR